MKTALFSLPDHPCPFAFLSGLHHHVNLRADLETERAANAGAVFVDQKSFGGGLEGVPGGIGAADDECNPHQHASAAPAVGTRRFDHTFSPSGCTPEC